VSDIFIHNQPSERIFPHNDPLLPILPHTSTIFLIFSKDLLRSYSQPVFVKKAAISLFQRPVLKREMAAKKLR